ncbi:MAG: hypothetical protein ACLQU4_12000 [Limisphaerales bacterium]
MRIIVTPAGGTAFVLGDAAVSLVIGANFSAGAGGQIKEGFVNKQKRRVQHSPLFRAAYLLNIARLNWENRFAFTVQRSFQTVEACVAFIAFHPDSVPAAGEITLAHQSGTGVVLRYLPAAVIEIVQCTRQIGLSCDFQYTIAGNGPWQTTP